MEDKTHKPKINNHLTILSHQHPYHSSLQVSLKLFKLNLEPIICWFETVEYKTRILPKRASHFLDTDNVDEVGSHKVTTSQQFIHSPAQFKYFKRKETKKNKQSINTYQT